MEQINSVYYPISINIDADPLKLKQTEGRFIKGTRFRINANNSSSSVGGGNDIITPVVSNEIFVEGFVVEDGINKTIGAFEFRELNEIYWINWNENSKYAIYLIDGPTETATLVYKGECLNLSLDPQYALSEHRVYMRVQYDEENGQRTTREKYLIFTDGLNDIRQVNVLASIGSSSFTTPYFNPVYPHYERCSYITLAPIAPMYKPSWELIEREEGSDGEPDDKLIPNKLFNRAIQIAYQFVYVDGRVSSISPYSAPIIVGGTDCSEQNPEVLPRCADIEFWVGNAFVDKINIYFRECTTCVTGTCNQNWFLFDTIEKHNCQEDKKWWLREGAWNEYEYDAELNRITYRFCADKECTPVDQTIFDHIENEVPFKAVGLSGVADRLMLGNVLIDSDNLTCEEKDSFAISVEAQPDDSCQIPKRNITVYAIIRNDSNDGEGHGGECQFLFGDIVDGANTSIDGRFYFGGMGWREHPVTGNMKVAIDSFWREYNQYVPADIEGETGGFVGYLAGTQFYCISKQVKLTSSCDIVDVGPIYADVSNMTKATGSFDSIIKDLKDGEYVFLQKFEFKDVPAGKYAFRLAGHRTGLALGYEKTSTYVYGNQNTCKGSGIPTDQCIMKDYEWIIDVCESDFDCLADDQSGFVMKILDNTLPDFESDARNVIDYNFVREIYLYEDEDYSVPFEQQQLGFEFGYFKDKITGDEITVDGFEVSGTPLYLIDPLTTNILGVGVPIPCPPAPLLPFAGLLRTPSGIESTTLRKTDHNGFGFHRQQFWRWRTFFNVLNCSLFDMTAQFGEPTLGTLKVSYVDGCNVEQIDVAVGISKVSPPVTAINNKGYKGLLGTVSKSTNTIDNPCNRVTFTGVVMSLEGKRLAGVNVGYSGSQFSVTDGFGRFEVVAHQDTSFARDDYFMISNSGNSCLIACGEDCEPCCESMFESIELPACGSGSDSGECPALYIDKGIYYFKKVNEPDKGLKGRYGFGVIGFDLYGRIVTGGVNNIGYIDTPECWSKHPLITWSKTGASINPEIKYLTFSRTHNLNGTILQWVADKFILIDRNGNETSSKGQAVAVAVDMTSLLEYNEQNNFGTLVSYGFVKGDILKIIADCENPIQYNITGTTFGSNQTTAQELELTLNGATATTTNVSTENGGRIIIPYDSRLNDYLQDCAVKIEIIRPYNCQNSIDPYCEVSDVVNVIDGALEDTSGEIVTWDTYKIFRNIPKPVGCSNNPSDDPYFSNNITDFWGENCNDCGRLFTENPYAQRRWSESEVCTSKAWVNNGIVNGLATFWGEDRKIFKNQNFGGIIAIIPQRGAIFILCENDYFVVPYDQNFLVVNENGAVQATLPDKIGEPNQKIGMNYGCSYEDTSSIVVFDGLVYWLDRKNTAYIKCNYNESVDVSRDVFKSYLMSKLKYIQNFNESIKDTPDYLKNMFEVVGGICPLHKEVHFTIRPRLGLNQEMATYINDQRDYILQVGETFVYNSEAQLLSNTRAYVPEYYGKLRTSKSGLQFITFVGGVPYKQNTNLKTTNIFFGVPTTPVIEFSANLTDAKVKIFESISEEIQPFALYIDSIKTEEPNSFSYVPQPYFKKKENIQYAELLRDMSSYFDPNKYQVSMLLDGKRLFGRYALVRLVAAPTNQSAYFELSRIWILFSGSELSMKPQVASGG